MLITVNTFNGETLNSASYQTVLLNQHGSTSAQPVYIEQANADSVKSGLFTVDRQNKVLSIRIKNYANRQALKQQIKQWFKRGTQGDLVVTFNDEGVDYLLPCTVLSFTPDPDDAMVYLVTLQTAVTAWRSVDSETESTWTVTGTGDDLALAVAGYDDTFLNVTLTARTGPASGYLHQNIYRLVNTPGVAHGVIGYCIELNTAALVSGGKLQADCDDLRIVNLHTGQELKRWIEGPNTTTTKVWIVLDMKKGFDLTLKTAVAGSGNVPYLQFAVDANTKAKIAAMDKTGIVYEGNEWFLYSNTDAVNCRLTISKRGLFGTSEEAHSVNDVFYFIQYPLVFKYGNSSATDPADSDDTYDDTKPLINMADSDNETWIWDADHPFYDPLYPNRACGWKFSKTALGPESKVFYVKQDVETGDAALGLKVESFKVGALWKAETVTLMASFTHAASIIEVDEITGDKYRSNANWLKTAVLQRLTGASVVTLLTITTPSAINTWQAWSGSNIVVAAGTYTIRLLFSGGYPGADSAFAVLEGLTCTALFNTAKLPVGAFLGETNSYPLELTLNNVVASDNHDDGIALNYPMLIDKAFVLDGENRTAQYDGVNAHSAVTLNDESRSAFIRLKGGKTNTLTLAGSDVGEIDVDLSYYRRRL